MPATLLLYHETLRHRFGDGFEIVIVVNGSTDGTARLARRAMSSLGQIRVVEIEEPVGKGGAVMEGFRQASGERVSFVDADGATASDSLLELFDRLDHHDIAIGSRRLEESEITTPQPPLRRVCGLAFAKTVRSLFGMPFEDTQTGAKALRLPVARRLAQDVEERHWTFDLDLLLSALRRGYDICEHPVRWSDQQGSRLRFFSTAYEVAWALLRIKVRQLKSKADAADRHESEPEKELRLEEGVHHL